MDASKQRKRLKAIAESEYHKLCEQYPIIEGKENAYNIEAFSILNTPRLGISYWHNQYNSGFSVCELIYLVQSNSDRKKEFPSNLWKMQKPFKKTKAKPYKNPFDCYITKEYTHSLFFDSVSDEILNSLENDIQLKKTIIYKNKFL